MYDLKPVLLEFFRMLLLDGFMIGHPSPAVEGRFVPRRAYCAVTIISMCAWRVRIASVCNVVYHDWRICGYKDFFVFKEVYFSLDKAGYGDVKRAARINPLIQLDVGYP